MRQSISQNMHSINFKTLGYLVLFSVTILLLLWVFQISFLSMFYERYQTRKIENIAKKLLSADIYDLAETLETVSYENNLCSEYVYLNGLSRTYNERINGCILRNGNLEIIKYKENLIAENKSVNAIHFVGTNNEVKNLLYAVKVDNGFIFLNTPLEDVNSTTAILRSQLIYITLIAILMACLISYFLAKRITKPITDITNQAKKIGKSDEDIVYKETGMAEIDELVKTLNEAQVQIEKNEGLRRDLMANVGHDLKTPLTMIKAYAELVKDFSYKDKKKREEHLDIIVAETDRLNILVNDIVELSKMQANVEMLDISSFNLSMEINEIIKRYSIIKETEDYTFKVEIPNDMFVEADKSKINQVIYNLVNNAINYTGIDKTVTIRATDEKNNYLIEIIDTGKGIKEHEIDKIWDKYYKNDKNHRRNIVGTGIGLSIVKQILTKHNFDFGVMSTPKKVSTFYFRVKKNKNNKIVKS